MDAFGHADAARVLVLSSALACLVTFALNPRGLDGTHGAKVFAGGVRQLVTPALILIGAWVLSSTLSALDASAVIAGLLAERMPVGLFPVAAVFSGAIFGDHCSPLSDTTIVSSISCGIEPLEHVRTQLPYALLAAVAAALIGFLPAGFGVPAWLLLPAGFGALALLPAILRAGRVA